MTKYYQVSIEQGIVIDEQKEGFYSKSPELNKTVFKSLRRAKNAFNDMTKAQIVHINNLRKKVRAYRTREDVEAGHEG